MKIAHIWKPLNLLIVVLGLSLTSCDKEDNTSKDPEGKATIKMNLTDAPASYDAVLVDIQEIRVHVDSSWITLQGTSPGIYDLLDFQNGLDTLIAQDEIPTGTISQIRLVLGPNNSLVENGVTHPLNTPSAQQSGLKLNVHYTLQPGLVYEFWLDFDASRSVVALGNGGFNLKPVIRVYTKNTTGSIEGYVDPVASEPLVLAYSTAGDSATAMANDSTGYFLLSGLPANTYTVEFDPATPYLFTDVQGVNVAVGQVTDMDTVAISQ